MERWMMRDPFEVVARLEEQSLKRAARSPESRARRAREGLEELFGEGDMGRKLEVPAHVVSALHQWGEWARRPNFWENLRVTPFCRLVGIDKGGGREPYVRLDPQSQAVHRAYHRLTCQVTKAVLYSYYVADVNWDDRQQLFRAAGVSRKTFYEALKTGSVAVFNRAGIGHQNDC